MKHHIALVSLLITVMYCLGQEVRGQTSPDDDVVDKFYSHFPDAVKPQWKKAGAYYYVSFTNQGLRMTAKYTLTGIWQYTDIFINKSRLPQVTLEHLAKEYPGYTLERILYHDSMEEKYYQVEIRKGNTRRKLRYHDSGYFWKEHNK
ncbi:MAG: hypothetical protein D6730_01055 [Bacteroidetes bacterium]|nr:MAG: hypothetical protein D6730_01055 [Bacteroidota bacterium]